jgi:cobalt/nickel transport protein
VFKNIRSKINNKELGMGIKQLVQVIVVWSVVSSSAWAHFQMIYMHESAMKKPQKQEVRLVFAHPFSDGHTMDMGNPKHFYVLTPKGKKEHLKARLRSIQWTGNHNTGKGFATQYRFKKMGDYRFVLEPEPYLEKNEDTYIQQITQVIVNVAGSPSGWDKEMGLKAEIVPLVKPYAIWEKSSFTGIVKRLGKPVPYAEIEVEYLNWDVDVARNAMGRTKRLHAPQDSFNTLVIKTNDRGEFTFAIPKAGWWGFCALGAGKETTYKGKKLSQDAVLWVQAKPLK